MTCTGTGYSSHFMTHDFPISVGGQQHPSTAFVFGGHAVCQRVILSDGDHPDLNGLLNPDGRWMKTPHLTKQIGIGLALAGLTTMATILGAAVSCSVWCSFLAGLGQR